MATVFFEGASELATLTNTFSVGDDPTDPSTVSLTITAPTQVSTTYQYPGDIQNPSTGVYTKDIPCTAAGTWTFEWVGTGSASDAIVGTWEVLETSLGKLYCTVEALKSSFKDARSTDDTEYHAACFAASRALENYCGRVFYRSTDTRTVVPNCGLYVLELPEFHDLVSVTSLNTDASGAGSFGTAWTAADYQLLCVDNTPNVNAAPEPRPYVKVRAVGGLTFPFPTVGRRDRVQIEGVWGWPAVPWSIKKAAEIIAAETFKLKDSPGMVAAGYEDFDVSMLGADARRRFARFANPYRRNAYLAA